MTTSPNSRRKFSVAAALILAGCLVVAVLWSAARNHCSSDCNDIVSRSLNDTGVEGLVDELRELDRIDARCDCMRFTEGDEPPEHSHARYLIRKVTEAGGTASLGEFEPQGAILKNLLPAD